MRIAAAALCTVLAAAAVPVPGADLERLKFRNPGLIVDLAVGLWATPMPMDWDGDGDMDLVVVCPDKPYNGTWVFENPGGGGLPVFAPGRRIGPGPRNAQVSYVDGEPRVLVPGHEYADFRASGIEQRRRIYPREQIHPTEGRIRANQWKYVDWEADGDLDIVCGEFLDRLSYFENVGDRTRPRFAARRFLGDADGPIRLDLQMIVPVAVDWDGDGDQDLGYTTLSAADWDGDDRLDLIVNSIRGAVLWYRNVGSRTRPRLAAAEPVRVAWPGASPRPTWNWWKPEPGHLVTQWRTTAFAVDFDRDGLTDLVTLDHEGFLALFSRRRGPAGLELLPGRRVFVGAGGKHLMLASGRAGRSGRRKIAVVDWDGDGDRDVLLDGAGLPGSGAEGPANVVLLESEPLPDGRHRLVSRGQLARRDLASHTTSPTVVDWNRDGRPELLVGAEDGHLYYLAPESD